MAVYKLRFGCSRFTGCGAPLGRHIEKAIDVIGGNIGRQCARRSAPRCPIGTGRIYDLMGSHSYAFDRDRMHCERARDARLPLAGVRAIAIDAGRDNGGVAARGSGTPAVARPGCPQGLLTQLSCSAVRMSAVHGSRAGIAASRTRAKSRLSNAEGSREFKCPSLRHRVLLRLRFSDR
jgi:hypothetical protein